MHGERRPSRRDENDDGRGGAQVTRAQTPEADLWEITLGSGRSSHLGILALGAARQPDVDAAGDQADSRLRGSNNTISPGAFEATMRLRPVAFAL
jgi:hypothetical protein